MIINDLLTLHALAHGASRCHVVEILPRPAARRLYHPECATKSKLIRAALAGHTVFGQHAPAAVKYMILPTSCRFSRCSWGTCDGVLSQSPRDVREGT
jgi:hypothetical protein